MPSDSDLLSEVGMAAKDSVGVGVSGSVVPKAVVIPTTIPDDGRDGTEATDVGITPLVGRTTLPGKPPLEPEVRLSGFEGSTPVGFGRPPLEPNGKFRDSDGWEIGLGDGIMNGPRIVDPPVDTGASEVGVGALGDTTVSGTPPVEPSEGKEGKEGVGNDDGNNPVELATMGTEGSTLEDGMPPVGATNGRSEDSGAEEGTGVELSTG